MCTHTRRNHHLLLARPLTSSGSLSPHTILLTILRGGHYCSHFSDGNTETWRSLVICPSHVLPTSCFLYLQHFCLDLWMVGCFWAFESVLRCHLLKQSSLATQSKAMSSVTLMSPCFIFHTRYQIVITCMKNKIKQGICLYDGHSNRSLFQHQPPSQAGCQFHESRCFLYSGLILHDFTGAWNSAAHLVG